MLTSSDEYEGGQLSTLEWMSDNGCDVLQPAKFEQGDALLFVSHKYLLRGRCIHNLDP